MSNFFLENPAVYDIMWEKFVEPGRPQMTIWGMRIAGWIPKATDTHSEFVILISFPLRQHLNITLYIYIYIYIYIHTHTHTYIYIACIVSFMGS